MQSPPIWLANAFQAGKTITMKLSEEHLALKHSLRGFIETEINPHVDQWEEAGITPLHELMKKMGELGLLGIDKPEAFGGMGLDYSFAMMANETLGEVDSAGVKLGIDVQTSMATPALARFGSDELREEFLRPAIAGDSVCSIAVSEVSGGSDVAAIHTSARKDGDDYVINGSKMWITNATQADWICLLVNTSDSGPHRNKSLVIVPTNLPGFSVSKKLDKLGMRASDTAQIFLDDVRVPRRHRIGEEGMGFSYQMQQFQEERLSCISNLRPLEIAIERTIEYCRERKVFGRPVLDNQVVHFRLAELQTEIEATRALFYRAAEAYIDGEDVTQLASMAKLKIGRLCREVSDACLQYWGGQGFMWDNPISRLYRDGRLVSIGGGTDEIMLNIISKGMGTLPR
jgi:citronellyl-CoA dehydrogenase